jgi:hypothetical protein
MDWFMGKSMGKSFWGFWSIQSIFGIYQSNLLSESGGCGKSPNINQTNKIQSGIRLTLPIKTWV